jgi:hypothetical protein
MSARRQALTARQRRCGLSERYLFSYEDAPAFTLNQLAGLAELGDFVEYGGQEFVLPTSMSYRLEAVALEVSVLALWQGPSILVSCYRSEHLALAVGLGGYVGLRQWLAFQE